MNMGRTMKPHPSRFTTFVLATALLAGTAGGTALACTRTLYVGVDDTVITGRTMDWMEDMSSNLWAFPAGMKRDGAAGPCIGLPESLAMLRKSKTALLRYLLALFEHSASRWLCAG